MIVGDRGNDELHGGLGDDTFRIEGADQGYDRFFGGEGYDRIVGGSGNDVIGIEWRFDASNGIEEIDGGGGFDIVKGTKHVTNTLDFSNVALTGIAEIHGGWGEDVITGTAFGDVIVGDRGNDELHGGAGNDTYRYASGDGQDVIHEIAGTDDLVFEGLNHDQLWFERSGDDLLVSEIGTNGQVTIAQWYTGTGKQLEAFQASDAMIMQNNALDQLVNAMAAFEKPASGETSLSAELRDDLTPHLAAAWQSS